MYDFDLFTIGGGSGGVRASRIAAQYGAKVAMAEERYLGGTCVNVGCIPKKLFVYASEFSEAFSDSAGFGWTLGERRFNWSTLVATKTAKSRGSTVSTRSSLPTTGCESCARGLRSPTSTRS